MDSVSNKNSLVFICWSGIQRKACICLVCSLSHTPARGFPVLYSSMFGISMDLRGFQEPVLRTNKVTSVGLRRAGTFFQNWKSLLTFPSPWANRASVWAAVPERRGDGRGQGRGTFLDWGVPGDSVECAAAGGEGSLRRGLDAAFENIVFQFWI